MRRVAVLAVLGGVVGLYAYDRGGPIETVAGQVVEVRTYDHRSGSGSHEHTEAVIEYEGGSHTLPRADGLAKGQGVLVNVRRGRLSERSRYSSFRGTEAAAAAAATPFGASLPEPWEFDPLRNQHWQPFHGHWHDGRPPVPGER